MVPPTTSAPATTTTASTTKNVRVQTPASLTANSSSSLATNQDEERQVARAALSPALLNATAAWAFGSSLLGEIDLAHYAAAMAEKTRRAQAGDLSHSEDMLAAQAASLDAIYCALVRRAALIFPESVPVGETFLRLGLKAQSQARATAEALARIKNPRPPAYVGQANLTIGGAQQINNAAP